MIPHKGVECTELHPSSAQFFSCIMEEATNIGTSVGNTEHVKTENG